LEYKSRDLLKKLFDRWRTLIEGESPRTEPAWSPDGSKIAFNRGSDVYLMNADGSNQAPATTGGQVNEYGVGGHQTARDFYLTAIYVLTSRPQRFRSM